MVKIEGLNDLSRIKKIEIEHPPGNVFPRATISTIEEHDLPQKITIYVGGRKVFEGEHTGTQVAVKWGNKDVKYFYKATGDLAEIFSATPTVIIGEKTKRSIFDKLVYLVTDNLAKSFATVFSYIDKVEINYPSSVTYTVKTLDETGSVVSTSKKTVPIEFFEKNGVVTDDGVCIDEFSSQPCPKGRVAKAVGFVAKNENEFGQKIFPGGKTLGWWATTAYNDTKVIHTSTLKQFLQEFYPELVLISDLDYRIWEDVTISSTDTKLTVLNKILGNLPRLLFYDVNKKKTILLMRKKFPKEKVKCKAMLSLSHKTDHGECLKGVTATIEVKRPSNLVAGKGYHEVVVPSATMEVLGRKYDFSAKIELCSYRKSAKTNKVLQISSPLIPFDFAAFLNYLGLALTDARMATVQCLLVENSLPPITIGTMFEGEPKDLYVDGFKYELSHEGIFVTLFLRELPPQ